MSDKTQAPIVAPLAPIAIRIIRFAIVLSPSYSKFSCDSRAVHCLSKLGRAPGDFTGIYRHFSNEKRPDFTPSVKSDYALRYSNCACELRDNTSAARRMQARAIQCPRHTAIAPACGPMSPESSVHALLRLHWRHPYGEPPPQPSALRGSVLKD